MKDEDVEEIRDKHDSDFVRDSGRNSGVSRRRFYVSFGSSMVIVGILVLLILAGPVQSVATFSSVGGFAVSIGELRGSDVALYPSVTESSNCIRTPVEQNPTDLSDRGLPSLAAEIGQSRIPSQYRLEFIKDIQLPDIGFPNKAFRIRLQRSPGIVPDKADPLRYGSPANPSESGQFIRSFTFTNESNIPRLAGIRESTATDTASGYRDLTQAKIYLVEGEDYTFNVTMRTIDNSAAAGSRTDTAAVAAFIDTDNSSFLGSSTEAYPIGSGDGGNNGLENVQKTFTITDSGFSTGDSAVMRVVMKVGESDPNNIDPTASISNGIVEDYTVVLVDSPADIPPAVTVGDLTLKTTGLDASVLDLRAPSGVSNFLLDDRYSKFRGDPSPFSDPVFGPDGEFVLSANSPGQQENVRIRNATARVHFASLSSLRVPNIAATTKIIDESKARVATQNCPVTAPQFIASITDAPVNVSPGDSFDVEGEVVNPGSQSETQSLQFEFPDGDVDDDRGTLTIPDGTTRSFDGTDAPPFSADAPSTVGRYDAVLRPGEDPADTEEIIVGDVPFFDVSINSATPDPVVAVDETLDIDYTVDNTGDVYGLQDIRLLINETQADVQQDVNISSGVDNTPVFNYQPSNIDAGDPVNVTLASEDDSASTTVTIYEAPNFDVEINKVVGNESGTQPIDAVNESLLVNATVTNTGEAQETQSIQLDIENSRGGTFPNVDSQSVTLDSRNSQDSQNVTLEFKPDPRQDVPTVNVIVNSDDDTARRNGVPIEGVGPVYQVEDLSISPNTVNPSPFDTPDTVTATFNVTNVGSEDATGPRNVNLTVDGVNVTSTGVQLNQAETVTFRSGGDFSPYTYTADKNDVPEIGVNVTTSLDKAGETVTVREPENFSTTITGINDPVTEGDSLDVSFDIENTGDLGGQGQVFLDVDTDEDGNYEQTGVDSVTEDVPAGGSTATPKTLSYTTQTGDGDPSSSSDNVSVRLRAVRTEDSEVTDLNSQTAEVLTPAFYEITDANVVSVGGNSPSPSSTPDVQVGTELPNRDGNQIDAQQVTMNVTVQNTGETDGGTQQVDFQDNNRDSSIGTVPTFTLTSGQTNTKAFTYTPDVDGPDTFSFNSVTFETSGSGNTLPQTDFYDIDSPEFTVQTSTATGDDIDADGGTSTITVDVENTGEVTDDQEVTFRIPSDQTNGGSGNGNNYVAGDQQFGTPSTSNLAPTNTDTLSADWTASCSDFDNVDSDNNAMDVEWDTEFSGSTPGGDTFRRNDFFDVSAGTGKGDPCE
jgi:hypothetical protein